MRGRLSAIAALVVTGTFLIVVPISCGDGSPPAVQHDAAVDATNLCAHCGTQACCDGVCTDTNTDTYNCGQCGNACVPGPAPECVMGICGCAANAGQACAAADTCCSNGCKNLQTDQFNCGQCGNRCTGNQQCNAGTCSCGPAAETCTSEQICCPDGCKNYKTDPANCGQCNTDCASCNNGVCVGGCGPDCVAPRYCCNGVCCSTESNCIGNQCMDAPDGGI